MGFEYGRAPIDGQLQQGEILQGVNEHRVRYPACERFGDSTETKLDSIKYKYTVVITPACDLEQDFIRARFRATPTKISEAENYLDRAVSQWLPHILLLEACDEEIKIKARIAKPDLWEQVQKNEHKRYHRFDKAVIAGEATEIPVTYYDFKKPIAIPSVSLYEGIRLNKITRVALIPPPYIYDFIQRFSSFFSRVGLPSEPDETD